jgi:hypothetical protein
MAAPPVANVATSPAAATPSGNYSPAAKASADSKSGVATRHGDLLTGHPGLRCSG